MTNVLDRQHLIVSPLQLPEDQPHVAESNHLPRVSPDWGMRQYYGCTGNTSWIRDGQCDENNNIPECGYDGGDCCYYSRVDNAYHSCGVVGYVCRDPEYM